MKSEPTLYELIEELHNRIEQLRAMGYVNNTPPIGTLSDAIRDLANSIAYAFGKPLQDLRDAVLPFAGLKPTRWQRIRAMFRKD